MTDDLSTEAFAQLRDCIYRHLGIWFADNKIYFLRKRVSKRLQALRLDSCESYVHMVRFADPRGEEMQALANLVTTNETYMFREYEQLETFANECLPEVVEARLRQGQRQLRIWSAGCSSGEEPYTLAIILRETLDMPDAWDLSILATDIDENMLTLARRGQYGNRSLKDVPEPYLQRHFHCGPDGARVIPATRRLVTFSRMNMNDHQTWPFCRGFDFIFCRNVMIYFDDASRKRVAQHFYEALNPGGYIFLGHSESMSRISGAFRVRRVGRSLVYTKGRGR